MENVNSYLIPSGLRGTQHWERKQLLIVELQTAMSAVQRARNLDPDDADLRGAVALLKRTLLKLDCPSLRSCPQDARRLLLPPHV